VVGIDYDHAHGPIKVLSKAAILREPALSYNPTLIAPCSHIEHPATELQDYSSRFIRIVD
jgi:hypothetical protein